MNIKLSSSGLAQQQIQIYINIEITKIVQAAGNAFLWRPFDQHRCYNNNNHRILLGQPDAVRIWPNFSPELVTSD